MYKDKVTRGLKVEKMKRVIIFQRSFDAGAAPAAAQLQRPRAGQQRGMALRMAAAVQCSAGFCCLVMQVRQARCVNLPSVLSLHLAYSLRRGHAGNSGVCCPACVPPQTWLSC